MQKIRAITMNCFQKVKEMNAGRDIIYLDGLRKHQSTLTRRAKKKPFLIVRKAWFIKVVPAGFEPATHGFSVRCSTN